MTTDPKITEAIQSAMLSIRSWSARERTLMGCDTLAGIREYIAIDLDEIRGAKTEGAALPGYDSHYAAYFAASRLVPDYARPTEKQIALLARLSTDAGEETTFAGHLTKRAASNLIDDYRKG